MKKLPRVGLVAVVCIALAVGSSAQSDSNASSSYSARASSPAKSAMSLPGALVSALAEVKAKSRIAVLLPSELPKPVAEAKYAAVDVALKNEYAISLYYELGVGNSGFAASFMAKAHPNYRPKDIANVSEVKLSHGLVGYFRAVSCGGSCAPANIWWEDDQILYCIQFRLSPSLPNDVQQRAMTDSADSAILAGPR